MKSWEIQEGEPETAYAHFLAFLTLGVGRTIVRAYRATHPESTSTVVSGVWRDESAKWRWRKRANEHDLSTFQEVFRETAAIYGESLRHLGLKALEAVSSDRPEMRPVTWEQALDAFAIVRSIFSPDTLTVLSQGADTMGDPPPSAKTAAEQDLDADGYLLELPEDISEEECLRQEREKWGVGVGPKAGEELDRVRTGEVPVYRPERYTPTFQSPTPPKPTPPAK